MMKFHDDSRLDSLISRVYLSACASTKNVELACAATDEQLAAEAGCTLDEVQFALEQLDRLDYLYYFSPESTGRPTRHLVDAGAELTTVAFNIARSDLAATEANVRATLRDLIALGATHFDAIKTLYDSR